MYLLPEPNRIAFGEGAPFLLDASVSLIHAGVPEQVTTDFEDFLRRAFGLALQGGGENRIHLLLSAEASTNPEGYRFTVTEHEIQVSAPEEAGLFYALQTLKQVALQSRCRLPAMEVEDAPRFAFRGFMLDVGRYFYPVAQVKQFIDRMALHKINVFHWHLTEDQGWRVEIKKYPKLTEVGSKRTHTNFGLKPHGGFYTQEEIKEVVRYAHSKYMLVIPELDIPGHMVSAIAAYPFLSCFDRRLPVATHWGVKHDILCAGKESTYSFLHDVIDELCDLFQDGWFHMGGDEAVKTRWKLCPHCQSKMKEIGVGDEEELQQWFMSEMNRYLKNKGYQTMMWNWDPVETTPWLDKEIVWSYCGGNEKDGAKEINSGRKIVNNSSFPYYLDLPYGWFNLKATYEYEPVIHGLTDGGKENVLGVEGPLWTEYVPSMKKADYCTYPRMGAIAESGWSRKEDKDFVRFEQGLPAYQSLLDVYGVQYATWKQAMPSKLRGKAYALWFNRRQLHWQGLHNLIDNALVAHRAKKSR